MSEAYTDYDLENSIRQIAAKLGIADFKSNSGKPLEDLFLEIESRCPEAAEILLERTFEKDMLRNYIANSPPFPIVNGGIVGEGDPKFEEHWNNLVKLYPLLIEALDKCND